MVGSVAVTFAGLFRESSRPSRRPKAPQWMPTNQGTRRTARRGGFQSLGRQDSIPPLFSVQVSFAGRVCKVRFPAAQNPGRRSFSAPCQRRNSNPHLPTPPGLALSKAEPDKASQKTNCPRAARYSASGSGSIGAPPLFPPRQTFAAVRFEWQ